MVSVFYLVLVFKVPMIDAMSSISIPQANIAQCQANVKHYKDQRDVRAAYCIAGVK